MDSVSVNNRVQVRLTVTQIRSIFAAINTAGMLSAGRINCQPADAGDLVAAISALEKASGLDQAAVDEWCPPQGCGGLFNRKEVATSASEGRHHDATPVFG